MCCRVALEGERGERRSPKLFRGTPLPKLFICPLKIPRILPFEDKIGQKLIDSRNLAQSTFRQPLSSNCTKSYGSCCESYHIGGHMPYCHISTDIQISPLLIIPPPRSYL